MNKKWFMFMTFFFSLLRLSAFDFNGVWMNSTFFVNNWKYEEQSYSWGITSEPKGTGFAVDLDRNLIKIKGIQEYKYDLDYSAETNLLTFYNSKTNEKETYSIRIISNYEIQIIPQINKKQSIYTGHDMYNIDYCHYFKVCGPKEEVSLNLPVIGIVNKSSSIYAMDGIIDYVDKNIEVKITGISLLNIDTGSSYKYHYLVTVNNTLSGLINVENVDITDTKIKIGE